MITDVVHNHHNYAWQERHFGRELIVVRKGATPCQPGQRSFVGGSMGDISVIIAGEISRGMMERWIAEFNEVELRGAGTDESPHVYKRLPEVLCNITTRRLWYYTR